MADVNNLMNFTSRSNATKIKGQLTPNTSVGAFRMFSKGMNHSIREDFKLKESEKAKNLDELSAKNATEKNLELDSVFNDSVKIKQELVLRVAGKLIENIKTGNRKFAMIPPTPEGILSIDSLESRMDTMSETELQMHIDAHSGNYQESAKLHDMAKRHNRDYKLQYEPGEMEENANKLEELLKKDVIAHIGEDPLDYLPMATFFKHEEGGQIYGMLNYYADYFDNLPIFVEDKDNIIPELTNKEQLISNLEAARSVCWKNKLHSLWNDSIDVGLDIQRNGLSIDNIQKAEKIIKVVGEMYPEGDDNKK